MKFQDKKDVFAEHFYFVVVDDHDFMQHLIRETLNSAEAGKIEKASNGIEAIKVLKNLRKVDFIITDFNMPKMDGLELLKAIRVGEAGIDRETPVIMLSGFDDEPLLIAATALDASGFITKPVSKIELVSRMNKIFMSENTIKDIESYQSVVLPEIDGVFEDDNRPPPSAVVDIPSDIEAEPTVLALEHVPVGSLVVEDVITKNDVLLIKAGTKINDKLIDFLIQTKEITEISKIVVCKL